MNLAEINIFPVKSLKGIRLANSVVEKRGLRFDRRWMITDREGTFVTQREVPKMATVEVSVNEERLQLSALGFDSVSVPPFPDQGEWQNVRVWQSTVRAEVYKGVVNEWLGDVLQRNCQLVMMPETTERLVNPLFNQGSDVVSFADGYPLLLIGEASLNNLNDRLIDRYHDDEFGENLPLPMNRFRPNVVVTGFDAFAEDKWTRVQIGEVAFRVAKPCARCVITTIDQTRGEFVGKEPVTTLATFRKAKDVYPNTFEKLGMERNAILFGQNLIPEIGGGMIQVGDEISVS